MHLVLEVVVTELQAHYFIVQALEKVIKVAQLHPLLAILSEEVLVQAPVAVPGTGECSVGIWKQ